MSRPARRACKENGRSYVGGKPCSPTKAMSVHRSHLLAVMSCLGILFAVVSDVWLVARPDYAYPAIWFLVLLCGLLLLAPAYRARRVGAAGVTVSTLHAAALFLVAQADQRTFFGGAMVPVVAAYSWVLVALLLLAAMVGGHVGRRRTKAGEESS